MHIAITGSHGLIGHALVQALRERGDHVKRLSRSHVPDLTHQDAVINLAGANIAGRRWSRAYKNEIRDSRLGVTQRVVEALNREAARGHALTFLSGSAVGFYGSRASEELTERSSLGSGFLASVVRDWEKTAATAHSLHRTVYLRTGHVLAPHGGILGPQRPLFKAGLGGPIGQGTQFLPWITLDDYVRAVLHLLDNPEVSGPVNMTGPQPVRQRDFAAAYGRALHRPVLLPTPVFAPRMVLGKEMTEELLLASQHALPEALQRHGFTFQHTTIDDALVHVEAQRRA